MPRRQSCRPSKQRSCNYDHSIDFPYSNRHDRPTRSAGFFCLSAKPYLHVAEILSRLFLGGVLVLFAGQTSYPLFIVIVGGIFLFVEAFLIVAGAKRHREFAVRFAGFLKRFRPAGVAGIAFGTFLIYASIAQ